MSPEERARAVVEHFAASLPPAVRPELERTITRAIRRAVHEELYRLERGGTNATVNNVISQRVFYLTGPIQYPLPLVSDGFHTRPDHNWRALEFGEFIRDADGCIGFFYGL